jgi:hypothetical protein
LENLYKKFFSKFMLDKSKYRCYNSIHNKGVMQIDFDAGRIGTDAVGNHNCGSRSGFEEHEDQ